MLKTVKLHFNTIIKLFIFICCIHSQSKAQKADTVRLYYDLNKSELGIINKNKIDSLLATNQKKDSINIFGYADYVGSNEYNYVLSEKRAIIVKNYLIDKGFKQSIKYCIGKGELTNKGKETAIDRKVEIIVYSKAASPPPTTIILNENKKDPVKDSAVMFNADSLIAGKNVILKGLYFKKGTDVLLKESYPELDEMYKTLKENPSMIIEIQGHICCELITYPYFNPKKSGMGEELSTKRAQKVYDYLVKKGINKNRMSYQGYGGSKPIVRFEKDETDANTNRRVEIKVIKN